MRQRLYVILLLFVSSLAAVAQRNVTPVESDDKKPAAPTLHYYDKHGNLLPEPVMFLAELDTVQNVTSAARPIYPTLSSLHIGLNFFDGILAIAGQKYGGFDIAASLSMWNWIFPTIEVGMGMANNTPAHGNFTYKGKPSPYFKLGLDYNFLYKSNPQYRVFLGLRACYSHFTFDITDISINSPYWQESSSFSLLDNSSHSFWGEVLAGLSVNIYKHWSLGWTFRYRTLFGTPTSANGEPWYIPGFGARTSHIAATFSVIYTIPLHTPAPAPAAPQE